MVTLFESYIQNLEHKAITEPKLSHFIRKTFGRQEDDVDTTERDQWHHCSGVFIVDFEHISHSFLVFLLLNLNRQVFAGFHLL